MSTVEFRSVEFPAEVSPPFVTDLVIRSILVNDLDKAEILQFVNSPFGGFLHKAGSLTIKIEMNNCRGLRDTDIIQIFQDGVVFFVHPVSPLPANHSIICATGLVISLLHDLSGVIILTPLCTNTRTTLIILPSYASGNDYRDGSGSEKEALRAGVCSTDPVVDQRPCEQTTRCLLKAATRPRMERKDAAPRAGRPSRESQRARQESTSTPTADTQSEVIMCDAAGCQKTTPGGGLCRQCQTERKWEQGQEHALDGEFVPDCYRCNGPVREKEYHPERAGVVLCQDCYRVIDNDRDAVADGGLAHPTTTVELRTERGKRTVEIERQTLATDAATIDQARKCAGVDKDEFNGGQIR